MQQLAGLIKESQLNEDNTMYYVHDEEGMEEPIGPFTIDQAKQELAKHGMGWKLIDAETAKQIWSHLEGTVENWNEIAVNNHENALKKELGDEGYENANIGWGVDENSLTVSSKIYPYDGNSRRVFKTEHDKSGNIIDYKLIEN
jgi:hypothetical protein